MILKTYTGEGIFSDRNAEIVFDAETFNIFVRLKVNQDTGKVLYPEHKSLYYAECLACQWISGEIRSYN